MQRRLTLAGMRPISNVVDVTNYVMLERCRPLARVRPRSARRVEASWCAWPREGEKMTTLDGVERTLTAARPSRSATASVRRRASPESWAAPRPRCPTRPPRSCSSRRTSNRAGSRARRSGSVCAPKPAPDSSAASTRTTRGAARRGRMELFAQVAGAVPAAGAIDVYPQPIERRRITVRTERVNQLLGTALSADDIADVPHAARHRGERAPKRRRPRSVPTRARDRPRSKKSRGASGSSTIVRTFRRARRRSAA